MVVPQYEWRIMENPSINGLFTGSVSCWSCSSPLFHPPWHASSVSPRRCARCTAARSRPRRHRRPSPTGRGARRVTESYGWFNGGLIGFDNDLRWNLWCLFWWLMMIYIMGFIFLFGDEHGFSNGCCFRSLMMVGFCMCCICVYSIW